MYRGQLEFYTLNSLDFYHVCSSGLPPDIMYDILEGYLPYTVKLMLNIFIANAYLSLLAQSGKVHLDLWDSLL